MAEELSILNVQERARAIEASRGRAVVATHGSRMWNEACAIRREGEELVCACGDAQTVENIRDNPRVALIVEAEDGERVVYSGIATVPEGSATVPVAARSRQEYRVNAYRASVTIRGAGEITLERRKLVWQFASEPPETASGRGSFAEALRRFSALSRAVSLPLSFIPLLVGSLLALPTGDFGVITFLLVILGGLSAHLGTNLVSDYFDFRRGVDTSDALSSHPGALVDERLPADRILIAGLAFFAFTAFAGGILTARVGWQLALIGLVGILGGWSYTGGKVGYKYRALGELLIGLLMGPLLVMAAFYVLTGRLALLPFLLSLPLGLLVSSVTLSNNMRDMSDDRRSLIRTLPMVLGLRSSKALYYAMLGLPYPIVAAAALVIRGAWPLLLVLLSLGQAWKAFSAMRRTGDAEDIRAKAAERRYPLKSIQLHSAFGLLLVAGIAVMISGLLPS